MCLSPADYADYAEKECSKAVLFRRERLFGVSVVWGQIGKVSFSMYIIHFFVIQILESLGFVKIIPITNLASSLLNFCMLYLAVALITFLIANITYKLIEIPGQNLGKKIIKKLDQQNKITV